jgi:predicted metal-dependent hydrolase
MSVNSFWLTNCCIIRDISHNDLRMDQALVQAITLFNREQFHEAHDCLEEFWRNYAGDDRRYYQALIQLIVALYLQQESRQAGASKVLARAVKNMEDYQNQIPGIDLIQLLNDVQEYLAKPKALPKIAIP